MLNKGLKSEEEQRINAILERMTTIVFVPDNWNEMILEDELKKIGLTVSDLLTRDSEHLHKHLINEQFPWNKMEQFADILVKLSEQSGYETLKSKARKMYEFIQSESKAFSFEIFNKINKL